jgi:threonine aldolase
MPSGTMANQFAIAMLSGENTKVFVQDTSHVYGMRQMPHNQF